MCRITALIQDPPDEGLLRKEMFVVSFNVPGGSKKLHSLSSDKNHWLEGKPKYPANGLDPSRRKKLGGSSLRLLPSGINGIQCCRFLDKRIRQEEPKI